MEVQVSEVTLLAFPRHDDEFHALLHDLAKLLDQLKPNELEARLRERYPRAIVRAQDPLGGYVAQGSAWYVYRDGSPLGD